MDYKRYGNYLIVTGLLLSAVAGSFAKDAKVRIHVKPEQAYIFIDGAPFGDSSRTITVAPGNHTIGVYSYGFRPEVRDVTLSEGRNADLSVTLDAVPGSVSGPWGRIQIEGAARAAVYMNGKTPEYFVGHADEFNNSGEWFNCCLQQLVVPAGTHELTLMGVGSKEIWTGSVTVPANERVVLYVPSGKQTAKPWPEGAFLNSLPRFNAGIASASIAVAPVSATISAAPAQINCGDSSNVSWQTSETVQRTITADSESLQKTDPSGSLTVQPKKTTTYQFQASGPGGSVARSATVNVNTAVQSSLDVSPAQVRYRRIGAKVLEQGASNVAWSSTNASSISIDPLGAVDPNGTKAVQITPTHDSDGPIDEVRTYTLTAKNDCGGSDTHTASVHVTGSIEPIPDVPLVSVFFPTGYPDARHPKAGLVPSQRKALERTAAGFKKYLEYDPDARLMVAGNADERDSKARNKPLSERRANVVKEYLVSLGIPESKIETVGNGKTQQLSASRVTSLHSENPNKLARHGTVQDLVWAYNRRVDIVLQPKDVHSTQYFPGDAPEAKFLADSNWPGRKQILTLASEKTKLPNDPPPAQ